MFWSVRVRKKSGVDMRKIPEKSGPWRNELRGSGQQEMRRTASIRAGCRRSAGSATYYLAHLSRTTCESGRKPLIHRKSPQRSILSEGHRRSPSGRSKRKANALHDPDKSRPKTTRRKAVRTEHVRKNQGGFHSCNVYGGIEVIKEKSISCMEETVSIVASRYRCTLMINKYGVERVYLITLLPKSHPVIAFLAHVEEKLAISI